MTILSEANVEQLREQEASLRKRIRTLKLSDVAPISSLHAHERALERIIVELGNRGLKPQLLGDTIGFIVTGWTGLYPVGTCAYVVARDREEAKRVLRDKLRAAYPRLDHGNPDDWTVEPVTPIPDEPMAKIILDGDY